MVFDFQNSIFMKNMLSTHIPKPLQIITVITNNRHNVKVLLTTSKDDDLVLWFSQGKVAYVPQQYWIRQTTLRNNILYNKPYNIARFDYVLDACALKPDLKILPDGDLTDIGEKVSVDCGQDVRYRHITHGRSHWYRRKGEYRLWSRRGMSAYYPREISQI